ncbi:MAG: RnfABCDGE type electron transport complex subunit D [Treponema sp.]|nr:RnfABCDGE type electron transport complex subunit D [Treponema sp.]
MSDHAILYGRSSRPLINLARSSAARMWLANICILMAIIQSSMGDYFSSLINALCAVIAAVVSEFVILNKSGRTRVLRDGSAVASALVLCLFLPNQLSPVYVMAGAIFAMVVVKHSFGGLGSNWLNPAAGGWLFVRFSWPLSFHEALAQSPLSLLKDLVDRGVLDNQGSPLGLIKTELPSLFAASPDPLGSLINNTILSFTGGEFPMGYSGLFSSPLPGIVADRGLGAFLVGTILLVSFRVSRPWITAVFLGVFVFLVRLWGAIPYGGEVGEGDILFALLSGGTLPAAFLLVSEPATAPKSSLGILFCTILAAVLAFYFRYYGGETYGVIYGILLINGLNPLIQLLEGKHLFGGDSWIKIRTPS